MKTPRNGYWLHLDRRDHQTKVVACLFTSKLGKVKTVETYIRTKGWEPDALPRGCCATEWMRSYTFPNGTMLTFWYDPSMHITVTP